LPLSFPPHPAKTPIASATANIGIIFFLFVVILKVPPVFLYEYNICQGVVGADIIFNGADKPWGFALWMIS
jgi:hypothetical protein